MDWFVNAAGINSQKTVVAGEEVTRKLAFSYPKGRLPRVLECAGVVVPLPLK